MENFEAREGYNADQIDIVWYNKKLEWLKKLWVKWVEALDIWKYDGLKEHNDEMRNKILDIHNQLLDLVASKEANEDKELLLNDIDNYKKTSEYDIAIKDLINDYNNNNDATIIRKDLDIIAVSNQALKTAISFGDFAWMEGNQTDVRKVE